VPVERPTFHESWYRVAGLKPRLRSTTQMHRQRFRGQIWYVVQDETNNEFFRLNQSAYRFVGMLDGHRTVAEIWRACNEELGDDAPTQGEALHILGQLYTQNLLHADLPPDTEGMLRRYRHRVAREVRGFLMNLLFVRIPLWDPDRFLDRWIGVFGFVFGWPGLIAWLAAITIGLCCLAGHGSHLVDSAAGILSVDNLPLLYLTFVVVKALHELAHGFACKRYGKENGSGGEVHAMGIMLLVFTPVPYVDASSSWAFRSRWQRVAVAASGILVETAIAAFAAVFWANTSQGTLTHAVTYNVMFVAGVSTLLFNGNPLLRYDGYYILSDVLEIANLWQRSREYLHFLVRRYAWGVKQAQSPAYTSSEGAWLLAYAIASTVYRVLISVAILLFVADKLFFVGFILAVAAVVAWVTLPLGRLFHYLATHHELQRVRRRAVMSASGVGAVVLMAIGLLPVPDRARAKGVVEPRQLAIVHMGTDGFASEVLSSGAVVSPEGVPLLRASNRALSAKQEQLLAERRRLVARGRMAVDENNAALAQVCLEELSAVEDQISRAGDELKALTLRSPLSGIWVSPGIERAKGAYLHRGDRVGMVGSLDNPILRVTASQDIAARLFAEASHDVQIRLEGRPDIQLTGRIEKIVPAGQERLPSAALGYLAGGEVAVTREDDSGTKTLEPFFEVRISPSDASLLLPGQRVVVRFSMGAKPLAWQWWRALSQLLQRRFRI
jgi:putative peptide zinc metalloprotease protein